MDLIKRMSNTVISGLAGITLIANLNGCNVALEPSGELNQLGIWECKPKEEGVPGPTYRFNSTSDSTKIWIGTSGARLEFYDLNSNKLRTLYKGSDPEYYCKCVEPKDSQ